MRRGFSLVELLVVVAVIALLAALVLPGLARAREYAYLTRCKSNQRQIGLGVLIHAADHKGELPLGAVPCGGGSNSGRYSRRIGMRTCTHYAARHVQSNPALRELGYTTRSWKDYCWSATIFQSVYMGPIGAGQNWLENCDATQAGAWTGFPRRQGKYLPVEILWDPIIKVKQWGPYGYGSGFPWRYNSIDPDNLDGSVVHAGTEIGRDKLTRSYDVFGYEFFTYSTGCDGPMPDVWGTELHDCALPTWGTDWAAKNKYEQPYRYATRSRHIRASHKPSAWVATCLQPLRTFDGEERDFLSHFGCREVLGGNWRFNVLHLDGHVDDDNWGENLPQCESVGGSQWFILRYADTNLFCVYGWRYRDVAGINWKQGVEPIPGFSRPFDGNK